MNLMRGDMRDDKPSILHRIYAALSVHQKTNMIGVHQNLVIVPHCSHGCILLTSNYIENELTRLWS